ncbi:MAG TPA: UDP-N-acetylmuramoyl-L-alanine--D-glutamate ligase [Gemmatimonadaceae bacterium]|nr:UDP-N-acetylmuramoyl-L-alanine--D-glutamate ligase [Gemmatimonadaceae bacterium]
MEAGQSGSGMPNAGIFRGRPAGEVAVIGLGKSGRSVATLLARDGHRVYASDAGASDAARASAEALGALGVSVDVGRHDLERIERAALVVASPGVPPEAPPLAAAARAGVPVVGEIEVALHYLPNLKYIAVTGTNGKTTTTALVGHLLRALGHDAVDAGNIGLPLAEVALAEKRPDWVALELSSFQLHDTPSVNPTVGVLTNLSPDHLDRYSDVDAYYADKARLFANAHAGSKWVVNADDAAVVEMASAVAGKRWTFSVREGGSRSVRHPDAYYDHSGGSLCYHHDRILPRAELPLMGDHNVANALAAVLAVVAAGEGHRNSEAWERLRDGLRSFQALKHRMEPVGEFGGVLWINDSKATNVSSTLVAVEGMTRPYVLLLGGRHKGEPYTALAEPFKRKGKVVLAYGESAAIVEQDLGGLVPVERLGSSFEAVMRRARELSGPGDAVLLSPACSSFDMFKNYEERGAEFRRLAAQQR